MRAGYPGTCACGCRRGFPAGTEIVRRPEGWVVQAHAESAPAAEPKGYVAEVLEILARARAVAARVARRAQEGT